MSNESVLALENVESVIHIVRGQRIMLDADLARIYGVTTSRLNQALRRNRNRFPADFVFQLQEHEFEVLRSQFVISKAQGGRRYLPWAFTEHGAIMLASVLNSAIAIEASVRVVRAFVYLREQLASNKELARKFDELEKRMDQQDTSIAALFEAIRRLIEPPTDEKPTREIGFHIHEQPVCYRIRRNRRRF